MSDIERQTGQFAADFQRVRSEIGKVIVGNEPIVDGVLTCLMIGGHVLLEGVPGLGKTLLVRTLSEAVHLKFSRIQFTPDLMPADITGTNILVEGAAGQKEFRFQSGPVFANIVLADEINRATPKTQSAMLEAMQEHSVTVAGTMHRLVEPFFVLATQNPIEMEGTYPLPEAQLDRFLFKVLVPYPNETEEYEILNQFHQLGNKDINSVIEPVLKGSQVLTIRNIVKNILIEEKLLQFIVKLTQHTRNHKSIY